MFSGRDQMFNVYHDWLDVNKAPPVSSTMADSSSSSTTTDDSKSKDMRKPDDKPRKKCTVNQYGKEYSRGRALLMEDRKRIIEYHINGYKINAISKLLCISHGCVSKIVSRYRTTGIVSPGSYFKRKNAGRRKKIQPVESNQPQPSSKSEASTSQAPLMISQPKVTATMSLAAPASVSTVNIDIADPTQQSLQEVKIASDYAPNFTCIDTAHKDYIVTLPDYPINVIESQYDVHYMPQIFQNMSYDLFDDNSAIFISGYQHNEHLMPHR